jgi:ribosomal protein S16
MDPIEAKRLALREAVALHAPHTGASDDDVVATAERLYQWLTKGAQPGEPIWDWPVTREEPARKRAVFADGLGVGTMDWPLVT